MTENKATPQPDSDADEEKDVEGHNMWIDPGSSTAMARNRNKELEKAAKERNRAKEAKNR